MPKKFEFIYLIALERLARSALTIYFGIQGLIYSTNRSFITEEFNILIKEFSIINQSISNILLHSQFINLLYKFITIPSWEWVTIFVLISIYGFIVLLEAIGLFLRKHWGVILTFCSTTLWIPIEIYEIVKNLQVWKVVVFVINLIILTYLARIVVLRKNVVKLT
jgi:uncharacterized membrane protein (DUF2068 family)